MGGRQSSEAQGEGATDGTREPVPQDLADILEENRHMPGPKAKYPFFVVQLNEDAELPYNDRLVSDAIAAHIKSNPVTHIIAQTHGWNTPPDKAVAVPFTQFIAGMQDDAAMPASDDFRPIFVAFIWPAVPLSFMKAENALLRAQLVEDNERQFGAEDSDIANAARVAAKIAAENGDDADTPELHAEMLKLAAASKYDEDDDDEDPEQIVEQTLSTVAQVRVDVEEHQHEEEEGGFNPLAAVGGVFTTLLNPVQNLMFGRLMARGKRTGRVMESVLAKFMEAASPARPKVTLMANSLGAHVLCGILHKPQSLPYKIHTAFFVQGAIDQEWFCPGGKYEDVKENVAGPVLCTYSVHDNMLKGMYRAFHGDAIGVKGVGGGVKLVMKAIQDLGSSPYGFENGIWNSVDGSQYIDEGNPIAGGHGDFKEDETTSLYWAAIKTEVPDSEYDR